MNSAEYAMSTPLSDVWMTHKGEAQKVRSQARYNCCQVNCNRYQWQRTYHWGAVWDGNCAPRNARL